MTEKKLPRRAVLKGALLGVAAVPVSALLDRTAMAASGPVDPSEPQAQQLGYVTDVSQVDTKANPNFKPGQACWNCLQAPGAKEGDAEVPCNIFGGRKVAGAGWCKVYVKRP